MRAALVAALCASCVTACGLSHGVETLPEQLPPGPSPTPAADVSRETSEPDTDQADQAELQAEAWAFVDAWWNAEQWDAAGRYAQAVATYVYALRAAAAGQVQHTRPAVPGPSRPTQPASGGVAPNSFLACVRNRESRGNYSAVNASSGAGGAYQFLPSTWRAMGGQGLPQNASPAEQDRMAAKLYAQAGPAPWAGPGC